MEVVFLKYTADAKGRPICPKCGTNVTFAEMSKGGGKCLCGWEVPKEILDHLGIQQNILDRQVDLHNQQIQNLVNAVFQMQCDIKEIKEAVKGLQEIAAADDSVREDLNKWLQKIKDHMNVGDYCPHTTI